MTTLFPIDPYIVELPPRPVVLFEMDGYDTVAAHSFEEAHDWYLDLTGVDEGSIADMRQVAAADMQALIRCEDDGTRLTFADALAKDLADGFTVPYVFSTQE